MSVTMTLVNPETGELVNAAVLAPGDRITSAKQRESYGKLPHNTQSTGRDIGFTFTAMDAIHEIISVLTTAQCGYLLALQSYVGFDGGRLINGKSGDMTTADMMDALQLKRKRQTFYDFLTRCLDNEIITKNEDGSYSVNLRYHFRGAIGNRAVVRSYTAKLRQVYREVKAVDLGLMYRMLPYVHYGTNALCANPLEKYPKKIRWFNVKELAEAIGVDDKTLSRRLPLMKFGNEYVIGRFQLGESRKFIFNPNVFYRNSSVPDGLMTAMFIVE